MNKDEYVYNAVLVRVIDGDTFIADIDLGFYMTCRIPVRMAHINAPEHNKPGGQQAKAELTSQLSGTTLVLKTFKPHDKYGRYLAEVYDNGRYINQYMLDNGYAKPYEGGER